MLAILPRYFGSSGDAVNERQLLTWMNRSGNEVVSVFSFHGHSKKLVKYNSSIKTITFPIPLSTLPTGLLVSFMIIPFLLLFRLIADFNILYVRSSLLALAPLAFKIFINVPIVVKFPAFQWLTMKSSRKNTQDKLRTRIREKILKLIDSIAVHKSDLLLVHGTLFRNDMLTHYNLTTKKVKVLPPGVNLGLFSPPKKQQRPRENHVGYFGSINHLEGVDILVKAMKIVQEQIPDATLIIMGRGPMLVRIGEMIRGLDVKAEIIGEVPHEEMPSYLRKLDVAVMPRRSYHSTERMLPLKLLEACASGIPCVITKSHVVDKYFRSGKDVLTANPEDVDDLARKILLLLKDSSLRQVLSRNASKAIEAFGWERLTRTMACEIENLISN